MPCVPCPSAPGARQSPFARVHPAHTDPPSTRHAPAYSSELSRKRPHGSPPAAVPRRNCGVTPKRACRCRQWRAGVERQVESHTQRWTRIAEHRRLSNFAIRNSGKSAESCRPPCGGSRRTDRGGDQAAADKAAAEQVPRIGPLSRRLRTIRRLRRRRLTPHTGGPEPRAGSAGALYAPPPPRRLSFKASPRTDVPALRGGLLCRHPGFRLLPAGATNTSARAAGFEVRPPRRYYRDLRRRPVDRRPTTERERPTASKTGPGFLVDNVRSLAPGRAPRPVSVGHDEASIAEAAIDSTSDPSRGRFHMAYGLSPGSRRSKRCSFARPQRPEMRCGYPFRRRRRAPFLTSRATCALPRAGGGLDRIVIMGPSLRRTNRCSRRRAVPRALSLEVWATIRDLDCCAPAAMGSHLDPRLCSDASTRRGDRRKHAIDSTSTKAWVRDTPVNRAPPGAGAGTIGEPPGTPFVQTPTVETPGSSGRRGNADRRYSTTRRRDGDRRLGIARHLEN